MKGANRIDLPDECMTKIAVTTTSFGKYDKEPLNLLEDKGFEVVLNLYGRKLARDESVELCRNAEGIVTGTEIIDTTVMENLPKLKVISRCGIKLDNIDLEVVKRLGIKVFNTPDASALAVAELTDGLILDL